MKTTRTELTLLIDKSGSMSSIKAGMEKTLNDFIAEQKKLPGECNVTLVEFDDKYDVIYQSKPLKDVKDIEINPRGGTALLDALGKTINTLEERLRNGTDEDTPDTIVLVCVSDGEENSSKEYAGPAIKKLIKDKTNIQGWKFVYFGTNQDAIATAAQYGFSKGSSMSFASSSAGLVGASATMSRAVTSYRSATNYSFSDEDRAVAMGGQDVVSFGNSVVPIDPLIQAKLDALKYKAEGK